MEFDTKVLGVTIHPVDIKDMVIKVFGVLMSEEASHTDMPSDPRGVGQAHILLYLTRCPAASLKYHTEAAKCTFITF